MRLHALLAALLLLPFACFAEGNETLPPVPPTEPVLIVKAVYPNGSELANSPVILLSRPKPSPTNFSVFRLITDQQGRMLLSLGRGQYELDAISNLPSTDGADFASTTTIDASQNSTATMVFYPAGSITGSVSYNGLPVADAEVAVSCPSNSFDYARINGAVGAKAGAFSVLALPVGKCMVSASSEGLAASSEVDVGQGQTNSARLELMPVAARQQSESGLLPLALAAASILIAAAAVHFIFFKAKKPGTSALAAEPKPAKQSAAGGKKAPRAQARAPSKHMEAHQLPSASVHDAKKEAVLSTLSEREREIAKCLISLGGRAKRSTLQHKLLIPKTSLIRNLRALERKNLAKLTPFGRNMVAELCGALAA